MNNFMQKAIEVAKESGADVPVGAVIVKGGNIIFCAHNEREKNNDVSAHAEILAMRGAEKFLGNWRLDGCELYITLEPCPMCAWAIIQSRIKTVYFGSFDVQYGALGSALDLRNQAKTDLKVFSGVMESECDAIIKDFWAEKRR